MFESKYFSITKLIKQYKDNWRVLRKSEASSNNLFDSEKIQLVSLGKEGYEYLKNDDDQESGKEKNRYFYLQCLLHGAIKKIDEGQIGEDPKIDSEIFEERLQDFLIKELQMLWGMYCFIDPQSGNTEDAKSYYLLGPFNKNQLKPSFTFPHFINISNFRDNIEFHKLPSDWLSFYIDLNAETRQKIEFKNDFVKFFGIDDWRRNDLEHYNNLLYISSGEMDHSILQWLLCYLSKKKTHYSECFKIDIKELEKGLILDKFFDSNEHASLKNKITFRYQNSLFLGKPGEDGEPMSYNLYDWLQTFGLLKGNDLLRENGVPTERLVAAIEFFYYHINHWVTERENNLFKTKNYFSKTPDNHYYGKHFCKTNTPLNNKIERFRKACQDNLPVEKNYFKLREEVNVGNVQGKVSELLESYFDVLTEFATKNTDSCFTDYCRFNIISHFFQRSVLPLFNPVLKEQTCRGFIITPVFSNPEQPTDKNLKYLGYFLGLIKDSDSKGRCYFNWRTHSDEDGSESETTKFFYNDYLFYLQDFVFRLGFNEVKQIYYRGIEENHKKETERQASRAAISQVMARNMSHNMGSHVVSRLVTPDSIKFYLDHKIQDEISDQKSIFKNYSTLEISSNDEQDGNQLFASFNSYQKSRMDFLADVTFGKPTIETTKMFFSEVMRDLDKNRILLENISGTSDFKYKFVIRNLTTCRNKKDKTCLEERNCCIVDSQTQAEKDIPVSIPNDILGCHAFYLIIENIIRNCAKHGLRRDDVKIYIDFDNSEREDDYYKVRIYDNSEQKNLSELVEEQNKWLNKDVLEGNKLRQGGWGLIEMEAAAAYLRKHPLEDINDDDFEIDIEKPKSIYPKGKDENTHSGKPNFLKAVEVDDYYGYRLFLMKPKELLIIYDETAERIINQVTLTKGELRKSGIKFIKIDELYGKALKEGIIHSYPILVFAGTNENFNALRSNESSLPIRKLVHLTDAEHNNSRFSLTLSREHFSEILRQDETLKILNEAWKAWTIRQFQYLEIKMNRIFLNQKDNTKDLLLKGCMEDGKSYFSTEPHVFFSDHAIDFCKTICTDSNFQESYSEPYNSKDYFLLGKFIKNDEKEEFTKSLSEKDIAGLCRLIEGTATTIHIIDERIQELAEKTLYKPERGKQQTEDDSINELLYIDLLYCTHVIIPQSDSNEHKLLRESRDSDKFNLNAKDFSPIRDKIIDYLRSIIKTYDDNSHTKAKADFLLIHLGIIEKLISSDPDEIYNKEKQIKEFIQNEILQNKNDIDTKVIVISGRGKPHNLPENSLYLNFSIVAQYCIENRLKYYLNEVVHSAKHI